MKKEALKMDLLLIMIFVTVILSFLSFKQSREAKINSYNAYQRAIHINNDLVEAGLIKKY